jgi:hypothetical protein
MHFNKLDGSMNIDDITYAKGNKIMRQILQSTNNLSDWPCKSFRKLFKKGSKNGSKFTTVPSLNMPINSDVLSANCSAPYVKCTVRFDLNGEI